MNHSLGGGGLQPLVRWGVKPVATLGEHIVLPFSRDSVATTAVAVNLDFQYGLLLTEYAIEHSNSG